MVKQLSALIVEDSHSDALLIMRALRNNGYDVSDYERVDNETDMIDALKNRRWDVIISDYSMPNFSATAALKLTKDNQIDIPFIIVSGTMGEEAAVAAMKAGACDYFSKGNIARLGVAVERELREMEVRRERREAEDRFTQAFQINPSSICITDLKNDKILDVNPRFTELFGYTREQVIGKNTFDLNLWSNPLVRHQHIEMLKSGEAIRDLEMQVRSISDTFHYVLVSCEVITFNQESQCMTFIHDITKRKQAENELRAIFNATSALFTANDIEGLGNQIVQAVLDEFNQIDCGLILIEPDDYSLKRVVRSGSIKVDPQIPLNIESNGLVPYAIRTGDLIYVPDVSRDPRYVANVTNTQSELVIPLTTPSRRIIGVLDLQSSQKNAFSERDIRVLTIFSEQATLVIELVTLYQQISDYALELEQRVADRTIELVHATEQAEAIIKNSSDAIAVVNKNTIIQETNLAFQTLFDYPDTDLIGQSLIELFDEAQGEMIKQAILNINQSGQSNRLELIISRNPGENTHVDLAIASILHEKLEGINFICSLRDISERKKIEKQLTDNLVKEKELSALKTRFISIVSHEFRTPLSVINTSADILMLYSPRLTTERQIQHLSNIVDHVKNLNSMIDDVLMIGTNQTVGLNFQPSLLLPQTVCETIIKEIQSTTSSHIIHFSISGECKEISLDKNLLNHILTNLLSNAIKYSPKSQDIYLDLHCNDDYVKFTVKDNGIGIPDLDKEHLFDEFHRAENAINIQGTGLGLSIVKEATEAHGGHIQIDSQEGVGTTFIIVIPIINSLV